MTITWTTFVIRLLVGFLLAVGIGIERQWLKTREVLKINVLVTLGSAMFVMLSIMTPGDSSPTRVASQIVSGVGFLGGGVILREGASVRGINTAATLWCTAAIGTLVGSGYLVQAYSATLVVVGANLLLRPLVETFKYQRDRGTRQIEDRSIPLSQSKDSKTLSQNKDGKALSQNQDSKVGRNLPSAIVDPQSDLPDKNSNILENKDDRTHQCICHIVCFLENEPKVFDLLVEFAKGRQLGLVGMESKNVPSQIKPGELEVEIIINFTKQDDRFDLADSQEVVRLLKTEAGVNSVNWKFLSKSRI